MYLLEEKCFSFGYSEKGRSGNMVKEECYLTPLEIKSQIIQLIVGNFHNLAVKSNGKIYGWGEKRNYLLDITKKN